MPRTCLPEAVRGDSGFVEGLGLPESKDTPPGINIPPAGDTTQPGAQAPPHVPPRCAEAEAAQAQAHQPAFSLAQRKTVRRFNPEVDYDTASEEEEEEEGGLPEYGGTSSSSKAEGQGQGTTTS